MKGTCLQLTLALESPTLGSAEPVGTALGLQVNYHSGH